MTALGSGDIIVMPIRSGVGLRLGTSIDCCKFTPQATWNRIVALSSERLRHAWVI